MIQLKNKNKIILIGGLLVLIFISFFFFGWQLAIKNKNKNQIIPLATDSSNTLPTRSITDQEKTKVNLEASQQAEVINDQNGFFVYKLKK